ncbi:hypothetical protein CHU00_16085 [Sphingobacterium cellulitidis]|nr:hypothetical protein CHU00_16085 [Sphingobacterium cellulitidis]
MIDGYWGDFSKATSPDYSYSGAPENNDFSLGGNYNDLILYRRGDHPSSYVIKLTVFEAPEIAVFDHKELDKIRKKTYKNNEWFEYKGVLEFYSNDKLISLVNGFPYHIKTKGGDGVMKKEPVTVKVQGFKKYPKNYVIIFNNNKSLGLQLIIQ